MPKKKQAPPIDHAAADQLDNDPPPPYSPSEPSGPPTNHDDPASSPSAPTAADVDLYDPEGRPIAQHRDAPYVQSATPRQNYGSIGPLITAGDVDQDNQEPNLFTNLTNHIIAHRNQIQAQINQHRGQANQLRAQGSSQFKALGNQFRENGNQMRSQLAGLRDQIQGSFNVAKNRYTQVSQRDTDDPSDNPNDPTDDQQLRKRRRRNVCVRTFFFMSVALFAIGIVIWILSISLSSRHDPPSSETPPPPAKSSSSSGIPPSDPSEPSGPTQPTNVPTHAPKQPDTPGSPNNPNDPPPDGSSCGYNCVYATYNWPLFNNIRAARLWMTGAVTSGNLLVKRSQSPTAGSITAVFMLTNVEKSDVSTVFMPYDEVGGTSLFISNPRSIPIFSSIRARIVVELPSFENDIFQEFSSAAKNTDVTISNTNSSETYNITKLDILTSNAQIRMTPLFTTSTTQQLQTSNGDISGTIRSTGGKVKLISTNANIDVDGHGDQIVIDTRNGDVSGQYRCKKTCNFKTSSGKFDISKLKAETLVVENGNGEIDLRGITDVHTVVVQGSNDKMKLEIQSTTGAPSIVLSNSNSNIDLKMPMEYQGKFALSTSKGNAAKVTVTNPPHPGHALHYKLSTGSYVSGTKSTPSDNSPSGVIQADTKNGDISVEFVSL